MAFDIENAGEHEIEFKYMPSIYVIGGIISAISTVIFGALIFIDCKKRKKVPVIVTQTPTETEGDN